MPTIQTIHAREILDSRGNPTIQVEVVTDKNEIGRASIPSGASTGEHEALELRDQNPKRFHGRGVQKAIAHVTGPLKTLLKGKSIFEQEEIDQAMIQADGTENKSLFGANAILGVSLAVAKAAAKCRNLPFYASIPNAKTPLIPIPMINILNGGAHADNSLDFQEFMIRPIGAPSFKEGLRWSAEVFHTLKHLLHEQGKNTTIGDEGGFAPDLASDQEAIELIIQAIEKTGYHLEKEFSLALDCAASEFFDKKKACYIEKKKKAKRSTFASRSTEQQIDYLQKLCALFPIDSIEDGLDQNDWPGWQQLTKQLGKHIQIVGDDLFVTHPRFLQKGIDLNAANAILIKPNQIGTLTETLQTITLAQKHGYQTIISHRSGETEDTFIADLAVATASRQIKTGSVCRSERTAKYNRLLMIEEELGKKACYASHKQKNVDRSKRNLLS